MMIQKIVLITLLFFMLISAVSAADNSTDILNEGNNGDINHNVNNTLSNSINSQDLNVGNVPSSSDSLHLDHLETSNNNVSNSTNSSSNVPSSSDDLYGNKTSDDLNKGNNNDSSLNNYTPTGTGIYSNDNNSVIYNINSSVDFKHAIGEITKFENGKKNIIINLTKNYYKLDATQDIVFNFNAGKLMIYGNGATIDGDGNVFLRTGTFTDVGVTNCTFTNCKPAIRVYGYCVTTNCIFDSNKRANTVDAHGLMRKGGAIDSYGYLITINCTYTNNRASCGGAICVEPNSNAIIANCKWGNNDVGGLVGYGDDVFVHNSAFAKIIYNATNEQPIVSGMQSSAISLVNLQNKTTIGSSNIVFNVTNTKELAEAFSYLSSGVYPATNVTINLANSTYEFKKETTFWEELGGHLKHFGSYIVNPLYTALKDGFGIDVIGTVEDFIENLYHEKLTSDVKDPDNIADYLCMVRAGLNVTINGNGATIKAITNNDNYLHLMYVVPTATVSLNNLKITGFGTAIFNDGKLACNNAIFTENNVTYLSKDGDLGGAIHNNGECSVTNCVLSNNYANYGGAIFNSASATLTVANCTFSNNKVGCHDNNPILKWLESHFGSTGYNDIADVGGKVIVINSTNNGDVLKIDKSGSSSIIKYVTDKASVNNNQTIITPSGAIVINKTISSIDEFKNVGSELNKYGASAMNIILKKGNYTYDCEGLSGGIIVVGDHVTSTPMRGESVSQILDVNMGAILSIDGNGSTIKFGHIKNNPNAAEYEYRFLLNRGTVFLKNMVLEGFTNAFVNEFSGQIVCVNCTFIHCGMDYTEVKDYGGAIHNEGILLVVNSTFINCFAKYGAAVYNLGHASYINCTAINNKAYNSGAAFYDYDNGCSDFNNCTLINSTYVHGEGPGMTFNAIMTYFKNIAFAATLIASAACAGAGLEVAAFVIDVCSASLSVAFSNILSVKNHHYVSPEDRAMEIINSVLTVGLGQLASIGKLESFFTVTQYANIFRCDISENGIAYIENDSNHEKYIVNGTTKENSSDDVENVNNTIKCELEIAHNGKLLDLTNMSKVKLNKLCKTFKDFGNQGIHQIFGSRSIISIVKDVANLAGINKISSYDTYYTLNIKDGVMHLMLNIR